MVHGYMVHGRDFPYRDVISFGGVLYIENRADRGSVQCRAKGEASTVLLSLVPRPFFSAALDVFHHQHAERKGLETLARFLCALEEFA